MVIHHEMIIHNTPERVYDALTRAGEMAVWLGSPAVGLPQIGETLEIQFERGPMNLEITDLLENRRVEWLIKRPMWPMAGIDEPQRVVWNLEPYELNTLVSFRMEGWPRDDGVFASVSYKWASFMMRLKVYLGDTREIDGFMVREPFANL